MLEESDSSDSWGSFILDGITSTIQASTSPTLLINGIRNKINNMSENILSDDLEKRLVIGTKKPQKSQGKTKNEVKKVTMTGQYPQLTLVKSGGNKISPEAVPDYGDWCAERQNQHYGQKKVISHPIDFTKKKKVTKRVKSSEENSQNLVQKEKVTNSSEIKNQNLVQQEVHHQTSDLLEKEKEVKSSEEKDLNLIQQDLLEKEKVIKSSEVKNQKLVQTEVCQTSDLLEKEKGVKPSKEKVIKSSEVKNQNIIQLEVCQTSDWLEKEKSVESSEEKNLNIIQQDLLENDKEIKDLQLNVDKIRSIKSENEKTITCVPINTPSQAKVTSKKSISKKKVETTNLVQPEKFQASDLLEKVMQIEYAHTGLLSTLIQNHKEHIDVLHHEQSRYAHTGLLSTLHQSHNDHLIYYNKSTEKIAQTFQEGGNQLQELLQLLDNVQVIESITTFDIMENSDKRLTDQMSEVNNCKLENLIDPIATKFCNNSDSMINDYTDANLNVNINAQIDSGFQCISSNKYDLNSDLQLYNSETCLSVCRYTCLCQFSDKKTYQSAYLKGLKVCICHYLEKQTQEHFESSRNSKNQNRK